MSWYDVNDVAEFMKVTPRTVQRWCRERRVPHVRVGRSIRFTAEQLQEIEAAYTLEVREQVDVSAPNPAFRPYAVVVPMKRSSAG